MMKNMDNLMNDEQLLQQVTGLCIDGIGYLRTTIATRLYRPRSLQTYGLVFVFEGDGEFASESSGYYKVEPGDCLLLFPGESHIYGPRGKSGYWREYWVLFSGNMIERLITERYLTKESPLIKIPKRLSFEVKHILEGMHERYRTQHSLHDSALYADLFELLVKLIHPSTTDTSSDQLEASEMREILIRHIYSEKRIEEFFYTDRESYHTLRLRFKQVTGLSPREFITNQRVDRAKELLMFSDLPIQVIAQKSGYQDPFYFSRLFKDREGVSPRRFRERLLSDSSQY